MAKRKVVPFYTPDAGGTKYYPDSLHLEVLHQYYKFVTGLRYTRK